MQTVQMKAFFLLEPLTQTKHLRNIESSSRSVAQLGSALSWGVRGRRFKSSQTDHLYQSIPLQKQTLRKLRPFVLIISKVSNPANIQK